MLRLNRFILASTTHASVFVSDAQAHNVVIWTQKISKFKHYALRVHIISQKFVHTREKSIFFMLCLADLQDLLCILRHLTYTVANPRWKIQLQVGANAVQQEALSVHYQESLLSPFEKLKGVGQSCKVKGNVDTTLAKRVEESMTPTVFWTRARCRDYYDIIAQKVSMARSAGQKKHAVVAHHIYSELSELFGTPSKIGWINCQMISSNDRVFQSNIYSALILGQCQQGLMSSRLWLAETSTIRECECECSDVLSFLSDINPHTISANDWRLAADGLFIRAAAHVGLGQYERAKQALLSALKLEPNALHRKALKMCEEFQSTASMDRMTRFKTYMTLIPDTPAVPPQTSQVSVLAGIDQERYVLRAYGYTGPFHMDTIVQNAGYSVDSTGKETLMPFDASKLDEKEAPMLARYAQCRAEGVRPHDLHVGPGNTSGPRGVANAYAVLSLDRVPHPLSGTDPEEPPGQGDRILHLMDLMNVYQVSLEELEYEYPGIREEFVGIQLHVGTRWYNGT